MELHGRRAFCPEVIEMTHGFGQRQKNIHPLDTREQLQGRPVGCQADSMFRPVHCRFQQA